MIGPYAPSARSMLRKRLSRKEKEDRLIEVHRLVQLGWGRMTEPDEWEFIRQRSDEELDKELHEMTGQLRFEKWVGAAKTVLKTVIGSAVALGVAGLLVFGIRQLLNLAK